MSPANYLDKVKPLLVFRLFLVTLLLGALILFEFIWPDESTSVPTLLYGFIILTYLLTIFYALRLPKIINPERFIQEQLLIDATLIAGFIYLTGGFYSLFFPLFYFIILGGTLYQQRQHTITLLFYCTFLYLAVIFAHTYNPFQSLLPLPPLVCSNHEMVSQLFFNLAPFYLAAFILRFIAQERLDSRIRLQKATKDLKEFKDLNEHIVASIDSGLITTDQQLNVNSINQAGQDILGLKKNSLLNHDLYGIIPGLPPAIEKQAKHRWEINYQQPQGSQLILGFSFTPLMKSFNRHLGWILIFQDLTELKAIEERLQASSKMAVIGRLSAGIAHEIRNPLAAISGSIEILAQDLPNQNRTQHRLMQIVLTESSRLNHLISNFLGVTRLENKDQVTTNLIAQLKDTVFLFRSQFPNIIFHENYHSDAVSIKANPKQLEQIFWNLLKNALEAVDNSGEITISSSTTKDNTTSNNKRPPNKKQPKNEQSADNMPTWIKIMICDNGSGINDEVAKEIFEPFFTTKAAGTGLGLYITFQLTNINSGSIQLSKREDGNRGTCAHLCFPAIN